MDLDIPEEFIAGYFNEIIYESSSQETSIEISNMDFSYLWEYKEEDGWTGNLSYLNEEETNYSSDENVWTVQISINEEDLNTAEENWTLKINTDGEVKTTELTVVKADTANSMFRGQLNFFFEPYQEGAIAEDSVTLRNDGNVNLTIEIEIERENLQVVGDIVSGDILEPGKTADIVFQYETSTDAARPPQKIQAISVSAKAMTTVDPDPDNDVRVYSETSYEVEASYFVGYEDYEQDEGFGYSVQYSSSIEVPGDSTNNVTFYIYPQEEVFFQLEGENVTFEEDDVTVFIHDDGERREIVYDPDESLRSGYDEVELTVQFESHHEDDGSIDLVVERDRYTTSVELTETVPDPGEEELSFVQQESETITLGIILFGSVALYIGGRVWLGKKRKEEEKTDHEKQKED
ncbi:MAG: hypothetical protein ACOCTR_06430 [Candidatus Natronoplasma sp.]